MDALGPLGSTPKKGKKIEIEYDENDENDHYGDPSGEEERDQRSADEDDEKLYKEEGEKMAKVTSAKKVRKQRAPKPKTEAQLAREQRRAERTATGKSAYQLAVEETFGEKQVSGFPEGDHFILGYGGDKSDKKRIKLAKDIEEWNDANPNETIDWEVGVKGWKTSSQAAFDSVLGENDGNQSNKKRPAVARDAVKHRKGDAPPIRDGEGKFNLFKPREGSISGNYSQVAIKEYIKNESKLGFHYKVNPDALRKLSTYAAPEVIQAVVIMMDKDNVGVKGVGKNLTYYDKVKKNPEGKTVPYKTVVTMADVLAAIGITKNCHKWNTKEMKLSQPSMFDDKVADIRDPTQYMGKRKGKVIPLTGYVHVARKPRETKAKTKESI